MIEIKLYRYRLCDNKKIRIHLTDTDFDYYNSVNIMIDIRKRIRINHD